MKIKFNKINILNSLKMDYKKNNYKYWLPFVLVALTIFILSHQPTLPYLSANFEYEDKIKHFIAFYTLGICFILAALKTKSFTVKQLFIINFVVCSLYGALDEFHQSFIIGRESEIYDWLADSIGGLVSCFFIPLINTKIKK